MNEQEELIAGPDDEGRRLDRILRISFPVLSLPAIFSALRRGRIRVGGHKVKPDYRLVSGDRISIPASWICARRKNAQVMNTSASCPEEHHEHAILLPHNHIREVLPVPGKDDCDPVTGNMAKSFLSGSEKSISPEDWITDNTLYRSKDLVFINKPCGMDTHGPQSLESIYRKAWISSGGSSLSLSFMPGPLHRLDRNTSGIVTFPLTLSGAREFSRLMRERNIRKFYLAMLSGEIRTSQNWEDSLCRDTGSHKTLRSDGSSPGAQTAITVVEPIITFPDFTFSCIQIKTGRTHQIRAQAALHGHPLVGDIKYDNRKKPGSGTTLNGYFLHAWLLALPSCSILEEPLQVQAEPDSKVFREITGLLGVDPLPICREFAAHMIADTARHS